MWNHDEFVSVRYTNQSLMKEADCIENEYIKTVDNESDDVCLQKHEINIQLCDFIQVANIDHDSVFAFRWFIRTMNDTSNYKHWIIEWCWLRSKFQLALLLKFIEFFIDEVLVCLIHRINFWRCQLCIRLQRNKHSFVRRQLDDEIVVFSKIEENFRNRDNCLNDERCVINDNIRKRDIFLIICRRDENFWRRWYNWWRRRDRRSWRGCRDIRCRNYVEEDCENDDF